MYARYDHPQAVAALLSVQPFEDVTGNYTSHDGKNEREDSVHDLASFPAGDAAAGTS